MPIVNIGTARIVFHALTESLSKLGLDFSQAISFMSETTNVMKGARSEVAKTQNPSAVCICHIANLTTKARMQALPINIDQLFVDIY